MHSVKSISDEAVKFSEDITMHSERVMNILEETQTETYRKFTSLENKFKVRKILTYSLILKTH